MGNSYSGNVNTGIKTGHVNFSTTSSGGPNFTIANGSHNQLKILYHKDKVKLEDLLEEDDDSRTSQKLFRSNLGMTYVDLPPSGLLVASTVNQAFASIFIIDKKYTRIYLKTISLNFKISDGKSFIVTSKDEIKFRKSDGGVWIDEDGNNHYNQ